MRHTLLLCLLPAACVALAPPPAALSTLTVVDPNDDAPAGGYLGGSFDPWGPALDASLQVRLHPIVRLDVQSQTLLYGTLLDDVDRRTVPWTMGSAGVWITTTDPSSPNNLSVRLAAALGAGDLFAVDGLRSSLVAGGELAAQFTQRAKNGSTLALTYAFSPTTRVEPGYRNYALWHRIGVRGDLQLGRASLVLGVDFPFGYFAEGQVLDVDEYFWFFGPRPMLGVSL